MISNGFYSDGMEVEDVMKHLYILTFNQDISVESEHNPLYFYLGSAQSHKVNLCN